jgi:uncharacterized membrane protein
MRFSDWRNMKSNAMKVIVSILAVIALLSMLFMHGNMLGMRGMMSGAGMAGLCNGMMAAR